MTLNEHTIENIASAMLAAAKIHGDSHVLALRETLTTMSGDHANATATEEFAESLLMCMFGEV